MFFIAKMHKKQVILAFVLIFLLGMFLRLYDIDRRPIHHDEGVFSSFVENILNDGYYRFDPEYHGPVMFYVSAGFMTLFGMQDFTLRLGTALFGMLTILLIWPMRKYLGDVGMLASAFFIATSPALVYYSRFSFHDVPFVLFYLLFAYSFFEYSESQKNKFLYIASVALAFIFSIKEVVHMFFPGFLFLFFTLAIIKFRESWQSGARIIVNLLQISLFPIVFYILNFRHVAEFVSVKVNVPSIFIYLSTGFFFILIIVLIVVFLNDRWLKKGKSKYSDFRKYFIPAIVSFLIISILFSAFYTAGFTQISDGLERGLNTPIAYNLQKIGEQTGHYKSVLYYAKNLFLFESLIFTLSIATVFLRRKNLFVNLFLFLSAYNFLLFSILSYKTPWHIVYIIAPMSITAGFAVQRTYDLLEKKRKTFFAFAIIFAVAVTLISYQISFVKYADEEKIPYVYVQSPEDFREMLKYIESSAVKFSGKNTSIDILSEEYWPLPWSLREYKNVAWHAKVIENPTGEIAIGNKVNETELDSKLENYSKKEFVARRGVSLLVYVKK